MSAFLGILTGLFAVACSVLAVVALHEGAYLPGFLIAVWAATAAVATTALWMDT
jgi:hypothetical protein